MLKALTYLRNTLTNWNIHQSSSSLLLFFLLLFTGCKQVEQKQDTVTIAALSGPSSMGMIKFIDSVNSASNSNINIVILNEPMQVRKMMLDGTAQFALLPGTMAALMYNRGVDFRLISVPGWGSLYLLGNSQHLSGNSQHLSGNSQHLSGNTQHMSVNSQHLSGDKSSLSAWEQLAGKRIYVMGRGMTPDILFRYLLNKNGIDPDKGVVIDYSFPTHIDLANAIAAGQVDLGVVSEPLSTLVLDKNPEIEIVMDLNREWDEQIGIPMIQTAFVGSYGFMNRNPEITRQIAGAYQRSVEWVNRYVDSAAVLVVKYNILPEFQLALHSIPRSNIKYVPAGEIADGLNAFLKLFYQVNPEIIGGKMPDKDFIYPVHPN